MITKIDYLKVSAAVIAMALAVGLLLALVVAGMSREARAQGVPGTIAFKSERDGNQEIYVMNADGSDETRLTFNSEGDFSPEISPDGTRLAFVSDRDGDEEIYVMDVAPEGPTNRPQRLTNNFSTDLRPSFSPNGTRLVFESNRNGDYDIFTMDAQDLLDANGNPGADGNGDNQNRLSSNPGATDYAPDFSPDGTRIAFSSNRDGDYEIYTMEAVDVAPADGNGDNRIQLTSNDSSFDTVPDFSPDGTRIAYTSNRSGEYKIYLMNSLDGSGRTRLAGKEGSEYGPDFSPDGTKIAFYGPGKKTANDDIYTIDVDGTSKDKLTKAKQDDTLPSWGIATP